MKKIVLIIVSLFVLSSCVEVEEKVNVKNAMLFYAASANNLNSDIEKNMNDIVKNYVATELKHLFIFFKKPGEDGILYRVSRKSTGNELLTIKTYDKSLNSATVDFLATVLSDIDALPEVDKMTDIVLSSHGSSWTPSIYVSSPLSQETPPANQRGRSVSEFSFGQDYVEKDVTMNIDEMAELFKKYSFDAIIFDACNMCSIEVLYQFRDCAKYIVSSPAEVLSIGMNYAAITKYFTHEITLEAAKSIAEESFKMYDAQAEVFNKSATFTVTDCSKLEELAVVIKDITARYGTTANNIEATPSTMIRYDGWNGVGKDYKQYLYNLIDIGGVEADKLPLDEKWTLTFPYYFHSAKLFEGWDMTGSSGVAGYIYREKNIDPLFNSFYKTLDWGKLIMDL